MFFLLHGALLGLLKGNILNENQHGSFIYFSHVYYLLHPMLSIILGWNIFPIIFKEKSLYPIFRRFMLYSFYFGVLIALLFYVLFKSGNSNYDSIDIWNIFYGGSFFLSLSNGFFSPILVIVSSLLLGKRVGMVSSLIISLIYYYKTIKKSSIVFTIIFLIFIFFSVQLIDYQSLGIAGISRIQATTEAASEDNSIDVVTAGRFIEASSAFQILNNSIFNLVFGMGFGSFFLPWPDLDSNYLSHYTHFTPISYFWIGGLFLPILVYFFLVKLLISIFKLSTNNLPAGTIMFFQMFLLIVVISSFSGAVLMNNSLLWAFIGMAFKLIDSNK